MNDFGIMATLTRNAGGIRSQLRKAFLLLTLCPFVIAGIVLVWQSYADQRRQAFELQNEIFRLTKHRIDNYFHALEDELTLSVQTANIINRGHEEQQRILSGIRSYQNNYHGDVFDDLVLLDVKGKELAHVSRLKVYSHNDLGERSDAPEFKVPMKSKEFYFSPISLDKTSAEPLIAMGLPIINPREGSPSGVLVAVIRLKDMWNFVQNMRVGKTGNAYILDSQGTLIVHKDPSLVLSGVHFDTPGKFGVARGLTGNVVLMQVNELKLGGQLLYLITEIPTMEALSGTFRTMLFIGILLSAAMGSAIAFGFLVERKVVRPIESLADTVRAISEGDLSRRAEPGSMGELGILSEAFNTMTAQLVGTIDYLQESEIRRTVYHERFVSLLDSLDSLVYMADMDSYEILFLNKYGRDVFGDITGRICWQTLQSGQSGPCSFCSKNKLLTDEGEPARAFAWEFQNTVNKRWYYIQGRAIRWIDGRLVRLEMATDITERKAAENKLRRSLEEKEVLLKEIHHRVKNNMQIISSLLDIQSGYILDSAASSMIQESRDRIRTMALIHEKLYKSADLGKIDFAGYIKDLTDYLYHMYVTDPLTVTLDIDVNAAPMDINTAVPVALIVNELFSNALKHAFPSGARGEIRVYLSSDAEEKFTLVIADNGAGFPHDSDPTNMETLGMQLVKTLVDQLKGRMEMVGKQGTEFRITFQQLKRKAKSR